MSKYKTTKRKKAGAPVRRRPKAGLRLLQPRSECATFDLITELSQDVQSILRGRERRRESPAGEDPPKAA